jgi:hypothetical protein
MLENNVLHFSPFSPLLLPDKIRYLLLIFADFRMISRYDQKNSKERSYLDYYYVRKQCASLLSFLPSLDLLIIVNRSIL